MDILPDRKKFLWSLDYCELNRKFLGKRGKWFLRGWDYQQSSRKLLKKCLTQSGTCKTILSSKGNSLVSGDIEVAHWTVRLTLSSHYKGANVQINIMHLSMFPPEAVRRGYPGIRPIKKHFPREFDRTLWQWDGILDSLVWDSWRHYVWPEILYKIEFCSVLKAPPGNFWHTWLISKEF